ncbi:hypothetical protein PSN01_03580 [Micromonospora saelicesensis]|nr:hypothetical protein PSN01_03580 [Micromonospora saelicesensis]
MTPCRASGGDLASGGLVAPGPCVTTGGPGSFRGWPIHRHPHRGGARRSFVGTVTTGWRLAFQPARPALRGRAAGRGAAIVRVCNDPGPAMIPAHGCARPHPTNAHQRANRPRGGARATPNTQAGRDPLAFTEVGASRTHGHPDFMKPESITNGPTAQRPQDGQDPPKVVPRHVDLDIGGHGRTDEYRRAWPDRRISAGMAGPTTVPGTALAGLDSGEQAGARRSVPTGASFGAVRAQPGGVD